MLDIMVFHRVGAQEKPYPIQLPQVPRIGESIALLSGQYPKVVTAVTWMPNETYVAEVKVR
jgi:hypothetical protein